MPALLIVVGTRTCSSTGGRRKNGVRVPLPALVFFIAALLMVVAALRPSPPAVISAGWTVTHLASLGKRVLNAGLPSVTGLPAASLAKRPFLLFWFMSQIERCVLVMRVCVSRSCA